MNEWIASAVAQKVGAVETAAEFLRRRAGTARAEDLHKFLALAPDREPDSGDELPAGWRNKDEGDARQGNSPLSSLNDVFTFSESGTSARAREKSGEFVVLAGSLARGSEIDSCEDSVRRQRAQFSSEGILVPVEDGRLRFTRDTGFKSPSRAASVVYGGNASGPQYWKHESTRQSYRDWRAERLQTAQVSEQAIPMTEVLIDA